MSKEYASIILKIVSLLMVLAASTFWVGSGGEIKIRFKDSHTIIGGTLWSQVIIPVGLIISRIIHENLDTFVQGYYLTIGVGLLISTGLLLVGKGWFVAKRFKVCIFIKRI